MGVINTDVNTMLARPAIFADLVNGLLHGGEQVLKPEDLTPVPIWNGIVVEADGRRKAVERSGDVRMKAENDAYTVSFFDETQMKVDYGMPIRCMLSDALEYHRQIRDLEKGHRERKELGKPEELLSGITMEDRLCPVVNLVLYLGEDWDGSRSLHEMLKLDRENEKVKELLPHIADNRLNVVPVRAMEHPERYKSCLQQIFCMLRLSGDKDRLYEYVRSHQEELDGMDSVEMAAAFAMLGEQRRLKELIERQKEEGEETSMCKAIDDLILDGEKRGREQGELIGEMRGEKRGREQGELIGEKRGEKRGQERLARLIVALSENHKDDLIILAASDSVFRRKLFKEYNL